MKSLFPGHTARGRKLRQWASRVGLGNGQDWTSSYGSYIREIEPYSFYAPLQMANSQRQLLFSVVVPFFNTPDKYLLPLLDSLTSQSYTDWQLVMADASTDERRAHRIRELSYRDPRFFYHKLDENGGISQNTNEAIKHASGRFIVFADHDDTLSSHALNEMAVAIADHPHVDVLYSDEDVLSDDGGQRKGAFFKPAWSPHMFLEMNYTNHLSVIRAALINEVGGLRSEYDGAQDYDLLLRIHSLSRPVHVVHIPKVLYHWREAEQSTARSISTKTYALDAGKLALENYLSAVGIEESGVENLPDRPGWYRIHPRRHCSAEIVVMVSDDDRMNNHFARILQARTSCSWVIPTFTTLPASANLKVHCDQRNEDIVIVIRTMFLPQERDWADELAGVLALPETAAVAPLLMGNIYNHILNAGLFEKMGSLLPMYRGCAVEAGGMAGPPDLVRDVDGLSSAVVAFPRTTSHTELFDANEVDGRQWSDMLVLWGHLRFTLVRLPFRDRKLNDNLVLSDTTVVLRNVLDLS